jgi:hypothetical protein
MSRALKPDQVALVGIVSANRALFLINQGELLLDKGAHLLGDSG